MNGRNRFTAHLRITERKEQALYAAIELCDGGLLTREREITSSVFSLHMSINFVFMEKLNLFFDRIKDLGFWQRRFQWRRIRNLGALMPYGVRALALETEARTGEEHRQAAEPDHGTGFTVKTSRESP
ncbi:MAG: hypothetical protein R2758_07530 [Bacteroidales bacterium]